MNQNFADLPAVPMKRLILGIALMAFVASAPITASLAQHSSGHSGGGKGGGGHSASGGGHSSSDHDTDSHDDAHGGRKGKSGTGAPSGGSSARGGHGRGIEDKVLRHGRASVPDGEKASGGRPVWAGGTIPENLELGRLNVARAPRQVLQSALDEAYSTNLDKNADGILDADADFTIIDSPRANLALYQEAVSGQRKVTGAWTLDQAAGFLGKAADKNIAINTDTVAAMDLLLDVSPDYSNFSYDRAAAHPSDVVVVFGSTGYTGNGIDAFAQAADDARAITLYKHDNR